MRRTLDLIPALLTDIVSEDGDAVLAVLRVSGPAPRIQLRSADGVDFSLSPGTYGFELELRGNGRPAPRLICSVAGAEAIEIPLQPDFSFGWRAEFTSTQTITGMALAPAGIEGAFTIARCRVSTEIPDPAPSLRAAAVQARRALYARAPLPLRRWVSRMVARRRSVAHQQAAAAAHDAVVAGGHIRTGNRQGSAEAAELEIRRADFDARFAIARGIATQQASASEQSAGQDARAVAFYLPQYHRIAENDAWWGAGFTEWTNVAKAVPQFIGHHQPRLPGELGFYDLTAPEALRRQVDLANAYGVSAFCFHYYWFAGKRLLERPLDAFLADKSLDLGFTLCWANENWTRRWDGAENSILMAQEHSREDHARVFDDMARYLEDPRALRIDGKPLVIVYRCAIIGDARAMTDIWRARAAERGWPGVFIAATDAFQFDDPVSLGFDALVEFPPHGLTPPRIEDSLAWLNPNHQGAVFDYNATVEKAVQRLAHMNAGPYTRFPGVMPSWDNEARRPGGGNIFHGATPAAYARWLKAACEMSARTLPADRRLVFINAWNEWAEGAYLEPDRKWGRAFLEAHAAVMGVKTR